MISGRPDVFAILPARFHRTAWRWLHAPAAMLLVLVFVPACAFNEHRDTIRSLQSQGRYDLIGQELDNPQTRNLYGKNDQLLWWLDRGAAALAVGDCDRAIQELEKAEAFMDVRHGQTAADTISAWLINDTTTEYIGEPYESIYVNDLKLIAQLERGALQGGATVEARRAASKADRLRDQYVKYEEVVRKEGGENFRGELKKSEGELRSASTRAGTLVSQVKGGQFIESTLGTYLAAVTFMATGDENDQAVAGRRLLDSIRLQKGYIGLVPEEAFQDLGHRVPTQRDLLVVALSGQAPVKQAERFGPIPVYQWPVYFEIPVLVGGSAEVAAARVVLAPGPAEGVDPATFEPTPTLTRQLALVEDLRAVATENHRRQLPLIYARAFLRSSAKAAAAFAASQAITNQGKKDGWTNAAVILGGLAFVALTERADLRCWVLLPGQAHVGLMELPPLEGGGEQMVRVEYLAPGGGLLFATPWRMIREQDFAPGEGGARLMTVVEHYWR